MIKEVRIFFTALMFFTRIPCPKNIDHSEEYLTKSSRYFPLVGIIVGCIGAIIYLFGSYIFPHPIALLLSMVSTIIATGAFHEDGLADVCDGFGGGWTKDDILRIMKDSRVGAFGVIGLILTLGLKFLSLFYIDPLHIPFVLITGHALSRFVASTLLFTLEYVREDALSKAKPAANAMSWESFIIGAVVGIAPLFIFRNYYVFSVLIPLFLARVYLASYFKKWIGGQTGDCAGATQQICEVIFYLSFIAIWKFI